MDRWTPELEQNIRYYGNCAGGNLTMLRNEHRSYSNWYWWLSNGIITCALAGSFLSTINQWSTKENRSILNIISNVLIGFTAFLTGINRVKQYETRIFEYKRYMIKFNAYTSNIRRQLALPLNGREDSAKYWSWITTSYDSLCESMPDISVPVQKAYQEEARAKGLPYPDDAIFETMASRKIATSRVDATCQDVPSRTADGTLNVHDEENPPAPMAIRPTSTIPLSMPVVIRDNIAAAHSLPEIPSADIPQSMAHDADEYSDRTMAYEMGRLNRLAGEQDE